jgi:hypothetical protein
VWTLCGGNAGCSSKEGKECSLHFFYVVVCVVKVYKFEIIDVTLFLWLKIAWMKCDEKSWSVLWLSLSLRDGEIQILSLYSPVLFDKSMWHYLPIAVAACLMYLPWVQSCTGKIDLVLCLDGTFFLYVFSFLLSFLSFLSLFLSLFLLCFFLIPFDLTHFLLISSLFQQVLVQLVSTTTLKYKTLVLTF